MLIHASFRYALTWGFQRNLNSTKTEHTPFASFVKLGAVDRDLDTHIQLSQAFFMALGEQLDPPCISVTYLQTGNSATLSFPIPLFLKSLVVYLQQGIAAGKIYLGSHTYERVEDGFWCRPSRCFPLQHLNRRIIDVARSQPCRAAVRAKLFDSEVLII